MKLIRLLKIMLMCFTAILVVGCIDEKGINPDADGIVNVTLRLHVADAPASRSWNNLDLDFNTELQSKIADGDIFVIFYDNTGKIIDIPNMQEIGSGENGYRVIRATVAMRSESIRYRVIANVAQGGNFGNTVEAVREKLQSYVGHSDTELSNALWISGFDSEGCWPLEKRYLPMQSGLSDPIVLNQDIYDSINLYRGVAKIGVKYIPEDEQTNFRLSKVIVRNSHTYGAFISMIQPNDDLLKQFESPFVLDATPLLERGYEYTVTDNTLLETIFVPDHANIGATSDIFLEVWFEETGVYDGGSLRYYLYFTEKGTPPLEGESVMDIVRNHSYIFQIRRVSEELIVDVHEYFPVELTPDFGIIRPE